MIRFVLVFVALFTLLLPVRAEEVAAADRDAFEKVITAQLNAFAEDDPPTAYDQAAPIVKFAFPQIEQFMAMVKGGYRPVYRNTSREFRSTFTDNLGRPSMRVVLTDENGKRWEAIYGMEKQADGGWKIASCVLIAIQGTEV